MRFVIAACLALIVVPARAEMVTFFTGVTTDNPEDITSGPKFDPSLGTLTSALFDIRNTFSPNTNMSLYQNTTDQTETMVYSARYDIGCCGSGISGGGSIPASSYEILGGIQTAPGVFEVPPLALFSITANFTDRLLTNVPAANPLDFYIATAMSDTFELFGIGGEVTSWDNDAIAFFSEAGDPSGVAEITVKYEFTPVSEIPLPAAFWLLVSGLLALVPVVIRR